MVASNLDRREENDPIDLTSTLSSGLAMLFPCVVDLEVLISTMLLSAIIKESRVPRLYAVVKLQLTNAVNACC